MVPSLSSGNDFVATYFDSGALAQLRDALKFLLQQEQPAQHLSQERSVTCLCILFQHASSFWPWRLPFVLCVFVMPIPFSL